MDSECNKFIRGNIRNAKGMAVPRAHGQQKNGPTDIRPSRFIKVKKSQTGKRRSFAPKKRRKKKTGKHFHFLSPFKIKQK